MENKEKLDVVSKAFEAFQKKHKVQIVAQLSYEPTATVARLGMIDLENPKDKVEKVEAEVVEK